jgi:predicted metal-dependent phosphoesterase TrpH
VKIDLHIHSATGSDGALPLEEVFSEAKKRNIEFLSITDHDAVHHQTQARELAEKHGIDYITGVELNVTFTHPNKSISLDFLGYGYNPTDRALKEKLQLIRDHREKRAHQIVDNLNAEFQKENLSLFTDTDLQIMQEGVDGILSRPHIADYLIKRGVVANRQEAFDKYLIKCDVPKYPLSLEEAAALVKDAGGKIVLAHPNDPNGTSLISITRELDKQTEIVREQMLECIDGIECWHSRSDRATTAHYLDFCKKHNLITTGGSDCHQKPIIMGTVAVPDWVAEEF